LSERSSEEPLVTVTAKERLNMIDRSKLANSFEFVVTAGARARQLMAGSTARVTVGEHKKTTIAQQEVVTKAVEKMEKVEPTESGN
jgi:DNA-directed RNA polymerase subunit K/omega